MSKSTDASRLLEDTCVLKALDGNDPSSPNGCSESSTSRRPREPPVPLRAPVGVKGIFRGAEAPGDYEPMDLSSLPAASVLLNVYDVGEEEVVQKINRWGTFNDKLLIGGVFHVGVQVYGLEYGYGMVEEEGISGVCDCPPRENWQHRYKCTVDLGPTNMSEDEVHVLTKRLGDSPEWEGCTYDVLHHNCLHFASTLCKDLGVRHMPRWLDRFGRAAVKIQSITETLSDSWTGLKQAAKDTGRDLESVGQQVRQSAPSVKAAITRWGSGLFSGAAENENMESLESFVGPEEYADAKRKSVQSSDGAERW